MKYSNWKRIHLTLCASLSCRSKTKVKMATNFRIYCTDRWNYRQLITDYYTKWTRCFEVTVQLSSALVGPVSLSMSASFLCCHLANMSATGYFRLGRHWRPLRVENRTSSPPWEGPLGSALISSLRCLFGLRSNSLISSQLCLNLQIHFYVYYLKLKFFLSFTKFENQIAKNQINYFNRNKLLNELWNQMDSSLIKSISNTYWS